MSGICEYAGVPLSLRLCCWHRFAKTPDRTQPRSTRTGRRSCAGRESATRHGMTAVTRRRRPPRRTDYSPGSPWSSSATHCGRYPRTAFDGRGLANCRLILIAFAAVRYSSVCRLTCGVNDSELARATTNAANCNHNCNHADASLARLNRRAKDPARPQSLGSPGGIRSFRAAHLLQLTAPATRRCESAVNPCASLTAFEHAASWERSAGANAPWRR